jgi:hypothetical protein
MNNYIDFGRLPVTEANVDDTLFGIDADGDLVRTSYYIKPVIDEKMSTQKQELTEKITKTEDRLTAMIQNVRNETVDIIGRANNRLSTI